MMTPAKRSPFAGAMRYRASPATRVGAWLRTSFILLGAFLLVIFASPLVVWWSNAMAHPWETASSGTLIVLSGPSSGGTTASLGPSSYWRSIYAVRTWQKGHFERVLLVGRPSAGEMAIFLTAAGVPSDKITVDEQPDGTLADALAVARLAPNLPAPLALLTSDFNIPLAAAAFHKQGLHPAIVPFPDGIKRGQSLTWQHRFAVLADLVEQSAQLMRYRWNGWI